MRLLSTRFKEQAYLKSHVLAVSGWSAVSATLYEELRHPAQEVQPDPGRRQRTGFSCTWGGAVWFITL